MSPVFGLGVSDLWSWVLLLGLIYVMVKVYNLYLTWRELDKALRPFEGPKRHWLYGNAHEFLEERSDLDIMVRHAEQYPYSYPIWLGNFFAGLAVCHPEYAKAVLSRQDPKDAFSHYFITPWIGKGLLVLSGEKWFRHRRMLTPGFRYDVLTPYVRLMSDCVTIMLDKWERLIPDKRSVEIFHHVSLMTLDTIMKCGYSCQSSCQLDSESAYIKAVYELLHLVDYRFYFIPYHNDLIFHLSPHGFRFRRALKIVHEHTDKVIQERKQSLKGETELKKIQKKRHLDFLDILLCAKGLPEEDLRAEMDTFMFEGHSATASGISWILYCLAKYPEHQEKCREEIRDVLGERTTVEWDDLDKLQYTTMCIKEGLRLYPPVPAVSRQLKEPITFPDGRSLPEGTYILLCIYAINRCPTVWEDPEVFDPLRFTTENIYKRHSYAYVPFSAGGRKCIGQNFALNEMKVAVALTLQRFELRPDPEREPIKQSLLVLRSMNGIHLKLKRL
ncbi:cytochrome P450 4B1-like [Engystomops pustulosus]|uniref:cytochrome P450 4B1-like n=1 Tax=Engystomops pustulosus TaxID=76066 RepID=UPI003AFB01D7